MKVRVMVARRVMTLAVMVPFKVMLPAEEMVLLKLTRSCPPVRGRLERRCLPPLALMVPLVLSRRRPGSRRVGGCRCWWRRGCRCWWRGAASSTPRRPESGRDVSGVEDRDAAGREDVVDFPGTFDGLSRTDGECGIGVVEGIDLSAGEEGDGSGSVSMATLRMRRARKVQDWRCW